MVEAVARRDGAAEARRVQLACSNPPEGRSRWTLHLLCDQLVELGVFESISHSTVHRRLEKERAQPWRVKRFCIPPEQSAAFVHAMEDVLEVYQRPHDPTHPQVCIDETSKQLVEHTRTPLPAQAGRLERQDDEYKRCGTANIFLCVEPITGKTVLEATERRTAVDFAHFLRDLCDGPYRKAQRLVVVLDNLNIHSPACLYEATTAWLDQRKRSPIRWRFTTKDARICWRFGVQRAEPAISPRSFWPLAGAKCSRRASSISIAS